MDARVFALPIVTGLLVAACAADPIILQRATATDTPSAPVAHRPITVGIAVSGGGSRAATFTAHVMDELGRIAVSHAPERSLIETIDYISSVSGGSLASAYYAAMKPGAATPVLQDGRYSPAYAKFFADFAADMSVNYELSFLGNLRDGTFRATALADRWDDAMFHRATFGSLSKREATGDSPHLILNGTSWSSGRRVAFTALPTTRLSFDFNKAVVRDLQTRGVAKPDLTHLQKRMEADPDRFRPITFEEMGASRDAMRVSLAVAASSSVPLVIGPVNIRVEPPAGVPVTYHIGDGGMFDNQGVESLFQVLLGDDAGLRPSKTLILIVDSSYPFLGSESELADANRAIDILERSPGRISDIMEQRARAYQLLLWAQLRAAGSIVPRYPALQVVYLTHDDVDDAILSAIPSGCEGELGASPDLAKVKRLLRSIPTRFEIDKKCHAPLLAAAARNVVHARRNEIEQFFEARP